MKIYKKIGFGCLILGVVLFIASLCMGGIDQAYQLYDQHNLGVYLHLGKTIDLTQEFSSDNIQNMDIGVNASKVVLEEYDGDVVRVECKNVGKNIVVKDEQGKLTIIDDSVRTIGFLSFSSDSFIRIQVPKGKIFDEFKVVVNAGEAKIANVETKNLISEVNAGDLWFGSIKSESASFDINAGDCDIDMMDAIKNTIDVDVGDFDAKLVGTYEDYQIEKDASLGDIDIDSENNHHRDTHNASRYINAKCDVGDIDIEMRGY